MEARLRVATELPLTELWTDKGPLEAQRERMLDSAQLKQLVRAGRVQFVVADPGLPLQWLSQDEYAAYWKVQVKPHLVEDPSGSFDVDRYPDGYAFVASEWTSNAVSAPIVLLERHH